MRAKSDEKKIKSFSLESLGKMYSVAGDNDLAYKGCFLAKRDSESLKQLDFFRYPCRINAYIAILCVKGRVRVIHNLQKYTITRNCFFISIPNSIIQIESWDEFELYIIAIDEDYARGMAFDNIKPVAVLVGIKKFPFVRLKRDEARSLTRTFHSITDDMLLFRGEAYGDKILSSSINLAAYKFFSIISKYQEKPSGDMDNVTGRQHEHYERFMQLLDRNFKNERKIGFYASELCITPKYLSTLVKKLSGKSAAEWINGLIIMEAKHLLRYSGTTIQEVSDNLNFPNQSFFTQYFRRETGITPSRYRREP